jgi:hypothetical protein
MDDVVAYLTVMKIKQWIEKTKDRSNGDWLLRRPRVTQGCSTERKEGISISCNRFMEKINDNNKTTATTIILRQAVIKKCSINYCGYLA